jgi:AhpD family alkylhydroperoxidase
MRGPSAWPVADRELMAAYVSKVNGSAFCVAAHTATAGQAYQDSAKVQAVLTDLGLPIALQPMGTPGRQQVTGSSPFCRLQHGAGLPVAQAAAIRLG